MGPIDNKLKIALALVALGAGANFYLNTAETPVATPPVAQQSATAPPVAEPARVPAAAEVPPVAFVPPVAPPAAVPVAVPVAAVSAPAEVPAVIPPLEDPPLPLMGPMPQAQEPMPAAEMAPAQVPTEDLQAAMEQTKGPAAIMKTETGKSLLYLDVSDRFSMRFELAATFDSGPLPSNKLKLKRAGEQDCKGCLRLEDRILDLATVGDETLFDYRSDDWMLVASGSSCTLDLTGKSLRVTRVATSEDCFLGHLVEIRLRSATSTDKMRSPASVRRAQDHVRAYFTRRD